MTTWINSLAGSGQVVWHLGEKRELRGVKTGTIKRTYYVTKCTGKQLGGAYGYVTREDTPIIDLACKRCAKIAGLH